jgi:group I intron endonuclease
MEIYKATNLINGKQYIGKTIFAMEIRQTKHISNLNTVKKRHYPLYSAIKKYGKENFEWVVIDTAETEEELNAKEIYWIKFYDTLSPKGYNLTDGGDGQSGHKHSEETKKKISENNYWRGRLGVNSGKKFSDEHRENLSKAHKGKPTKIVYDERVRSILREQKLGEKNPMYGKQSPRVRKVINLDTLEIYDSLTDITRITGIVWQNVRKVCIGNRKTAGGFRWMFYDEYMSIPSQADG